MEFAILGGLGLVALGIVCFYGIPTTMERAKAGQTISFQYLQPHHEDAPRSFETVVDKFKVSDSMRRHLNATSGYRKHDPMFIRNGNLLVTEDREGQVRQYYTGRGIMVRRHLFGGVAKKLAPSVG
tara:strand:+ start:349 stop:726 length:378 start_codon:yes stop_codon:yes gene_type:complete